MSSTILLLPRTQLCIRYCNNKHTHKHVFQARGESKVAGGLAAAKTAALRINLNVEGCGILAAPVHAPLPFFPPPSFTQSPSPRSYDEMEPRWPLRLLVDVCGHCATWVWISTDCIMSTNSFYPLYFFLSKRAYPIFPNHISRSQCNSLCHVTLSHTYTVDAKAAQPHRAPHTFSSKTGQKPELRPHTTDQSKERKYPTISKHATYNKK
jgi:hypothetical protein